MRVDAETQGGERIESGRLPLRPVLALDQQEVGKENQAAIGNDAGLERAQGSGGGVAGIDGGRQTLSLAFLVQALKGGLGHHDFAADFEALRAADLLRRFAGMERGTLRMVRMLEVTSSPVWPSPRVMPVARRAPPSFAAS